ncbi:hypothetical protein K439DRAFT_1613392 [Ramaria rubella]|nr:hypothetical protein K439DRAFT_1613392 [Ramaria rubella]
MASQVVDPMLCHLLSPLTKHELHTYRAEVIDPGLLMHFPVLFPMDEPVCWVQLPELQKWPIQRAHLPGHTPATSHHTPTTPKVKHKDAQQEVVVISSDSESEYDAPQKKVKTECGVVKIKHEQDESEGAWEVALNDIVITWQLKVSKVEHLTTLPCFWPIPDQSIVYVLDLSNEDHAWLDAEDEPIGMDFVIREHDQDNWGSGSHSTDPVKCPQVVVLDHKRCKHILLKCQGCYICDHLDLALLHNCVRQDYDYDQMHHVWEAKRKLNEYQGSSVSNITAVFFNQIQKNVCSYEGVVCEGHPVMRQWCQGNQLGWQMVFVGCSEWRKEHPAQMHHFISIPYNVNEDLLMKMVQNHGDLLADELDSMTCALVVPQCVGAKMKQCSYPHEHDGQVVARKMVLWPCPAQIELLVPLDKTDHHACVIPHLIPHNHPAYPQRKLFEVTGVAPSTRNILGGVSPPKFHPAFSQQCAKEHIIKKLKEKQALEGFGLPGVLACREEQKLLPKEKQYIHRVTDVAGIQIVMMLPRLAVKMHVCTFGKWKEWEVVVWDTHLDMHMWYIYNPDRSFCDQNHTTEQA